MSYFFDQFTGNAGLLTAHIPQTGGAWSAVTTFPGVWSLNGQGLIYPSSPGGSNGYLATTTGQYNDVSGRVILTSQNAAGNMVGVMLRYQDAGNFLLVYVKATGNAGAAAIRVLDSINYNRTDLVYLDTNPVTQKGDQITVEFDVVGGVVTLRSGGQTAGGSAGAMVAPASLHSGATTLGIFSDYASQNGVPDDTISELKVWQYGVTEPSTEPVVLSAPQSNQVTQHRSGRGAFLVSAAVATNGVYEWRWTGEGNSAPWRTLGTAQGGVLAGTINGLPIGSGTLSVRLASDTTKTASVTPIHVGEVVCYNGQSNASGYGSTPTPAFPLNTFSSSNGFGAGLFGNDDNWKALNDPCDSAINQVDSVGNDGGNSQNPTYWPLLGSYLVTALGRPVGFINNSLGGQFLSAYLPSANHEDAATLYGSMLRRIRKQLGGVSLVLLHQGENDAQVGAFTGKALYKQRLITLATALYNDCGARLMAARVHYWTVNVPPSTTLANVQAIHEAIEEAAQECPYVLVGPNFQTPEITQHLHFDTHANQEEVAARWVPPLVSFYNAGSTAVGAQAFVDALKADPQWATVYGAAQSGGVSVWL